MDEREYVIITDSTTDMPIEYYSENGIEFIGFHYTIDDEEYIQYSENTLDPKDFYSRVRNGSMPKTSQLAYEDLFNMFEKYAQKDTDLLFLSFSSALSGSYQAATLAAKDVKDKYPECSINIVDTVSASGGEGLLLDLCVKAKADMNLEEITQFAETMKYKVVHLFTVDDLNHLHRGGRVSKLTAVFGGMLGIKPILHVNDLGQLIAYAKVRGRKASLDTLAKHMKQTYTPSECEKIIITHGDCLEDAEYLGNLIMKTIPEVKEIVYSYVGAVIGAHSGPGTVALFYVGKNRATVEG